MSVNLGSFISTLGDINNSKEKIQKFRIWAENIIFAYKKQLEVEEQEVSTNFWGKNNNYEQSSEKENIDYEWKYVPYDSTIKLYSQMGWEIDEYLKGQKMQHYDDADCFGYNLDVFEVLKRISALEDSVEFCYALILLTKSILPPRKLYKYFVKEIYEGLSHYELIALNNLFCSQDTVFVAMSFSDEMRKARGAIAKAINECGYTPIFIDAKEHNSQIVPEIFFEIKKCKFLVADLTGQRGGVYYEAGYAHALEKQVILSCNKNEIDAIHFDVSQINTIFWEDESDLQVRLEKRIESTIGKR